MKKSNLNANFAQNSIGVFLIDCKYKYGWSFAVIVTYDEKVFCDEMGGVLKGAELKNLKCINYCLQRL